MSPYLVAFAGLAASLVMMLYHQWDAERVLVKTYMLGYRMALDHLEADLEDQGFAEIVTRRVALLREEVVGAEERLGSGWRERLARRLREKRGNTKEKSDDRWTEIDARVISVPLPEDHWLTAEGVNNSPMPFRMGTDDPRRGEWVEKISKAARYAVRASTMNGKSVDFDPDAMVENFVVGMLGYWTRDGESRL